MGKCQICGVAEGKNYQRYDIKGQVVRLLVCARALKVGYCKGVVIK